MSEIVLFHSALGLRPGVHWFADRLRAAGHTVHTPDLYDGEVFDSLDGGGLAKRDALRRGRAAVEPLGSELVYAGFSLGAAPAQMRQGARGALLYHSAIPAEWFGPWPAGVPLQIHTMEEDPGSAHLFADPDLPEYDEAATELVIERTLAFLVSGGG
jgi:dienelactone hydrolase